MYPFQHLIESAGRTSCRRTRFRGSPHDRAETRSEAGKGLRGTLFHLQGQGRPGSRQGRLDEWLRIKASHQSCRSLQRSLPITRHARSARPGAPGRVSC